MFYCSLVDAPPQTVTVATKAIDVATASSSSFRTLERAYDCRADSYERLEDYVSALADWKELSENFADGTDETAEASWRRKTAEATKNLQRPSHQVLGVERNATRAPHLPEATSAESASMVPELYQYWFSDASLSSKSS